MRGRNGKEVKEIGEVEKGKDRKKKEWKRQDGWERNEEK